MLSILLKLGELEHGIMNFNAAIIQPVQTFKQETAMPFELLLLFAVVAAVLIGVIVAIWRYWESMSSLTPEEEAFDKRVAALNERQSNRMSDDLIRANIDDESAWRIMVERGRRAARRRNRYSGELDRRSRERRRR